MNASSSRIAIALSCLALVATTVACSAGPDGGDTSDEAAGALTAPKLAEPTAPVEDEGPATWTGSVTAQATAGDADQSTLEAGEEDLAPDEQFVAAGQSCGSGRSLRLYRANACRVGVTSAGTGDTITVHRLRWSIFGYIYKCTIQRTCVFNSADGPGCGEGGEPTPPNSYCNQNFPNSESEQFYWGEGTIPSGYTPVSWCQAKYTERAADIQTSAVRACNDEATRLANGTRRDLTCCVPTTTLTSASTTISTTL